MRTTLVIDDDVLGAARELARRQNKTAGQVISELARRGIHRPRARSTRKLVGGFEILPAGDRVVTPELVQRILEETGEGGSRSWTLMC